MPYPRDWQGSRRETETIPCSRHLHRWHQTTMSLRLHPPLLSQDTLMPLGPPLKESITRSPYSMKHPPLNSQRESAECRKAWGPRIMVKVTP